MILCMHSIYVHVCILWVNLASKSIIFNLQNVTESKYKVAKMEILKYRKKSST